MTVNLTIHIYISKKLGSRSLHAFEPTTLFQEEWAKKERENVDIDFSQIPSFTLIHQNLSKCIKSCKHFLQSKVLSIPLLHADKQVKLGAFHLFILQSYESIYIINIVVHLTDKTLLKITYIINFRATQPLDFIFFISSLVKINFVLNDRVFQGQTSSLQ